jgi:hypothetical protein
LLVEPRWVQRLGPPFVGLAALVLLASTSIAASGTQSALPACVADPARVAIAAAAPAPRVPADVVAEPWVRLDPVLDDSGTLAGQWLEAAIPGDVRRSVLALASESFVSGPVGHLVLYGSDDGQRSEIGALDLDRGCTIALATEPAVVRSAVLDPARSALYEHRVDRHTRVDLGVFRRPIAGGPGIRILPPLANDDRFGPTFGTELAWSHEGRLAVHACGPRLCRLRVLDPADGAVESLVGLDVGPLVGLVGDRAIVYRPCLGLPCPIAAIDIPSGRQTTIATSARIATIVFDGKPLLAHETSDGHSLRIVGLDGSEPRELALPSGTDRLVPSAGRSLAPSRVPAGWLAVSPETAGGRLAIDRSILVRLADGTAVELSEVSR